jgi:hypothetical protein
MLAGGEIAILIIFPPNSKNPQEGGINPKYPTYSGKIHSIAPQCLLCFIDMHINKY